MADPIQQPLRQTRDVPSIKTKFVVLFAVLLTCFLAVGLAWSIGTRRAQTETELVAEGQAMAQEMDAVWKFLANNQKRLSASNHSLTGSYAGLHCAIAGRSIARLFTVETDRTIRFANYNPRNPSDYPDEFESDALDAFQGGASKEHYGFAVLDGEDVFRYAAPMSVEKSCLECHGEPVGEIDVAGYPKEGWQVGDVGGIISIAIPTDLYYSNERAAIFQDVVFFVALFFGCILIVYVVLSSLVTKPLAILREGMGRMKAGDLSLRIDPNQGSSEINALVSGFNSMSDRIEGSYSALEGQVEERTWELREAYIELERANQRLADENRYKSEFFSMMSHELRTPLTSIIAHIDLLMKDGPENGGHGDGTRDSQIYRDLAGSSRSLLLMVNDILEMSRSDAGRLDMNLELFEMGDVMGMVDSVICPLAKQKDVGLSCFIAPDVPPIEADFEKVRRIIENLCGNAVKYTQPGGHVSVEITRHDPDGDLDRPSVWVAVSDDGVGIAPSDHQRIFERFVQVDSSSTRRHNGTGLGLALAKCYAEMHHGRIDLASELGKGSTFTLKLPLLSDSPSGMWE